MRRARRGLRACGIESLYTRAWVTVLQRRSGLCAAQIRQRIRLAAGKVYRHGYFVWRGASHVGHARRPQLYGDGARDYLCTQLFRRVHSGHRAHRRGLLQLCPLVGHLDRREFFGGGSTVGAWGGSGEHVRARSQEIWGHRAHPWFGWKGVSECKESAGRTQAHNTRSELPASAT